MKSAWVCINARPDLSKAAGGASHTQQSDEASWTKYAACCSLGASCHEGLHHWLQQIAAELYRGCTEVLHIAQECSCSLHQGPSCIRGLTNCAVAMAMAI